MRFHRWWTSATKYRTSTIFSSWSIIRKISSGNSRRWWCFGISRNWTRLSHLKHLYVCVSSPCRPSKQCWSIPALTADQSNDSVNVFGNVDAANSSTSGRSTSRRWNNVRRWKRFVFVLFANSLSWKSNWSNTFVLFLKVRHQVRRRSRRERQRDKSDEFSFRSRRNSIRRWIVDQDKWWNTLKTFEGRFVCLDQHWLDRESTILWLSGQIF